MGGLVKAIFGGNKEYAPPPPPAPVPETPPTIEDAATSARENEDAYRKRKGRAAAVLTGKGGAGAPKNTATKVLLGE